MEYGLSELTREFIERNNLSEAYVGWAITNREDKQEAVICWRTKTSAHISIDSNNGVVCYTLRGHVGARPAAMTTIIENNKSLREGVEEYWFVVDSSKTNLQSP